MAKGYWVVCYRSISDPDAVTGSENSQRPRWRPMARAIWCVTCLRKLIKRGLNQRTVVIEFDSVEAAITAHDSPGYQAAMKVLIMPLNGTYKS